MHRQNVPAPTGPALLRTGVEPSVAAIAAHGGRLLRRPRAHPRQRADGRPPRQRNRRRTAVEARNKRRGLLVPILGHGVASLGRGAVGAQDDILEDLRLVTDADDLASDVDRHIVAGFRRQHMILLPAGANDILLRKINDKFNAQSHPARNPGRVLAIELLSYATTFLCKERSLCRLRRIRLKTRLRTAPA